MIIGAIASLSFQYLRRIISKKVNFVRGNIRLKGFIAEFIAVVSWWDDYGNLVLSTDLDYDPLIRDG